MAQELKRRLRVMDDYDFEHFVAELWEKMGWDARVSQASMDAGIDVIATKEMPYPEKKVIQAKCYGDNTTVGGPDIQQYASLKHQVEGADSVVVITTSDFTSSARERARELNVKLVDGEQLVDLIKRNDAYDLVSKYIPEVHRRRSDPSVADGGATRMESQNQTSVDSPNVDKGRIDSAMQLYRSTEWHQYVIYALGGAMMVLITVLLFIDIPFLEPIATVLVFVWLAMLVSIPVAWYMDMRRVRAESDWSPTAWMYLLGGIILPFVAFPLYYYRRRKYI